MTASGPEPSFTFETAEERTYRRLVEAITDYAIYMLDAAGVVCNWNPGAQRFKGYTADEIIGIHFSRFYTDEDRDAGLPMRALETAAREGRFEAEGWRVRKDGNRFWAHVVIDRIQDEDKRIIGFAKITRDITERREAQVALEQAREALFQSQKLDALGQLTGGVAHDFNNLLQALAGCLHLIGRRTQEPAVQPLLDAGRQAVDRGAKLVQQLMTFSRRESLRAEPIDVLDHVLRLRELLDRALRADIALQLSVPPRLWPVKVDATQFEVALLNLAVNARDAMPRGGVLEIAAENIVLPPGHLTGMEGDFVRFVVRDTGCGMPPEVRARAFEPFFTTKPGGKGSGLGLPQVYGLARQAGGTAYIESESGRGTSVILLLPRSLKRPQSADATVVPETSAQRGGRVLLVEDDPVVAITVTTALEDEGWQVLRVTTADEALPLLESPAPLDVLFSDVVMPGWLNGISLADTVRQLRPNLPIVLATGHSEELAQAGGTRVLVKPYGIDELIHALQAAMSEMKRLN